ncbi:MAG TPA: homoserine dehydrogenase [Sulfurovum sp.]|nr:MAG: homoserine dehydrogenase [Sulfurovum sp. 35-42-20]OYZ26278.1 MAG: homoserine dehydrogenase [Sulfurovum sp. 16-42-52]OYZ49955.1 MAG: homoserine dehydrogenase [Sulfurovum sp. 24-42-9]OZA46544.1 MAG: homoserine dehydrogenase [Sulfurovum sp. 17-42-90]OZA59949.1 MAG: homoserine dehydrogenase [Sulfurovum sp. 39-42-12]HQS72459.1 homoserine dehydrogenase [Sulfurovum sp.]
MVKIGILGVGTVGASVVKILEQNADIIEARAGQKIVVTSGVVKNLAKERGLDIKLSDNPLDIVDDPEIDIVVELMGGVEEPYMLVKRALKNGKAVVTANKALLAYHRYELQELAGDIPLMYEASTAGGIPIIGALRNGLSANHIESIQGIMNGTCNYMLTKMINEGAQYDAILKEAQTLGYAEADPTFDVGGFDASHKLLILASIAFGIDAKPEDILIEGIQNINQTDVAFAKDFGYAIKLLGIAKKVHNKTYGEGVELRVHATMIPQESMIAKVDGVMNAVAVVGDRVGETLYYGAGAGGDATASAVISDIIDIVRGNQGPMLGYKKGLEFGLKLLPKEEICSHYYLRMSVDDKKGVLATVTQLFSEHDISIEAMMQNPDNDHDERVELLFITHECQEKMIQEAIQALERLEVIYGSVAMIRIEQ